MTDLFERAPKLVKRATSKAKHSGIPAGHTDYAAGDYGDELEAVDETNLRLIEMKEEMRHLERQQHDQKARLLEALIRSGHTDCFNINYIKARAKIQQQRENS